MEITVMTDSEERYNNRQIERMLDSQSSDLKEHITSVISPLTIQVTKTNGRVRWLEKMIWMALGALALLTPWAIWMTSRQLEQPKQLTRDDVVDIIYQVSEPAN